MPTVYALDTTGVALANKVTGEQHALTASTNIYNVVVPNNTPFYSQGFSISYRDLAGVTRTLVEGIDYYFSHMFVGASRAIGKPVYGSITLLDMNITGVGTFVYQTLGGTWAANTTTINTVLSDILRNPRTTTWEMVANVPTVFPPVTHNWDLVDMVGETELVNAINLISAAIAAKSATNLNVTLPAFYPSREKVGLSNVDNFKTATDSEASAASSATRFMTPRGVSFAISAALAAYESARKASFTSATLPTVGSYQPNDYVICTDKTKRTWSGTPANLVGAQYIVRGWLRATNTLTHVLNTDWFEDRVIIG